jgi:hypothetical protein
LISGFYLTQRFGSGSLGDLPHIKPPSFAVFFKVPALLSPATGDFQKPVSDQPFTFGIQEKEAPLTERRQGWQGCISRLRGYVKAAAL